MPFARSKFKKNKIASWRRRKVFLLPILSAFPLASWKYVKTAKRSTEVF